MGAFLDHVEMAKSKGLLAKKLYVVYSVAADAEAAKSVFAEHLAYQKALETKGVMFAAGPIGDENEDDMGGESLIIYRAQSIAEANEHAANDPMHKAGGRTYRVRPWCVNEGSFALQVTFSDGKYTLD